MANLAANVAAKFYWPVRVYYEDTDNGGVVYYANYLKFMERARTEWLRSLGLEQDRLISEQGIIFAVRSVQVDYLKPALFNQLLSVSAEIIETGKASLTFKQEVVVDKKNKTENSITKGGESEAVSLDQVLCRGQIKIACLDVSSMRPCAIPDSVRKEILGDN
ncbi:MAG: tol-pal system-associated acyl-CoA thioesterase [Gammaproteobacteria bacterium]|nr:tol-pal system-associated acyl-CoA thioesterase [Gammaproteobacteria bacterium]